METSKDVVLFYCNRIARIALLYYLTALPFLLLPLLQHFGSQPLKELVLYTFALQDWQSTIEAQTIINPPAHSISSEAFFYLAFPLLTIGRRRWMIPGVCFSSVLFFFWIWNQNYMASDLSFTPLIGLAFFVTGILTQILFSRLHPLLKRYAPEGASGTLCFTAAESICLLTVIRLAISATDLPIVLAEQNTMPFLWFDVDGSALAPAALALSFACVLFVFACQKGLLSRVLKHQFFVLLGNVSFAFFLFHYGVVTICHKLLPGLSPNTVPFLFPCALAISLVASFVLYRFVEEPARRLIGKRAGAYFKSGS